MDFRYIFPCLLMAVSATPQRAISEESEKPLLSGRVKEMIHWLPANTETLLVANGPFETPSKQETPASVEQTLRRLSVDLIVELRGGLFASQLQGQKIRIALKGSRRFRAPKGLGMMPYEGCQIIEFDMGSDAILRKVFLSCLAKAENIIRIDGHRVATFSEKRQEDDWSFFVANPQPRLLICATNQAYLDEVLSRMKRKQQTRALPQHLPEWRHIEANRSVWAIRHFSQEEAIKDPTSPLRPESGFNVPDPKAVGLVFHYNTDKKIAQVLYLSGARNAVELVTRRWRYPEENLDPAIQERQPGIVEVSAAAAKTVDSYMFVLILLQYLGHGVAL